MPAASPRTRLTNDEVAQLVRRKIDAKNQEIFRLRDEVARLQNAVEQAEAARDEALAAARSHDDLIDSIVSILEEG